MGANRLPILAAEIRKAHADVQDAARAAAEHAITAGKALIEAKGLVKHGEWLPWLREHCALAERTAQVYMQIAKTGLTADVVAEIGLKAAAKVDWVLHDPTYDPFAHCDERGKLEWYVFQLWLVCECGWYPEGAWLHTEWVLQRQFAIPAEWLSEEAQAWRVKCGWGESLTDAGRKSWAAFLAKHGWRDLPDIQAELERIHAERGAMQTPARKRTRRTRLQSNDTDSTEEKQSCR